MYTIAICDDDSEYAGYLERMIKSSEAYEEQMTICHYQNGEQLLSAEDSQYDLVFMDMQYGSMDGYHVALQLREKKEDFVLVLCWDLILEIQYFA